MLIDNSRGIPVPGRPGFPSVLLYEIGAEPYSICLGMHTGMCIDLRATGWAVTGVSVPTPLTDTRRCHSTDPGSL